ncbi:hypothetical protein ACH4OQ_24535 [Streptomyces luteogriseus]|uniref:hypothetical protein n=1 Tax=Streptomyces luteogriseus TaxID=68233 RepID=UPI0037ACD15F
MAHEQARPDIVSDMGLSPEQIAARLTEAAETIKEAQDLTPWNYGWSLPEYRRSEKAALSSPNGPVTMSTTGVAAYEEAVESLLKQASVRDRWDSKEIWGLVASLVAVANTKENCREFIDANLPRIIKPGPALALFPVSNVTWNGAPHIIGDDCVIGLASQDFIDAASGLGARAGSAPDVISTYLSKQKHEQPLVCFAATVPEQRGAAFEQATRKLESVVDIALLLEPEKEQRGLYSLRGPWNRPGVRGLTLDRRAIEKGLQRNRLAVELHSEALVYDELGVAGNHRWYSANPISLSDLLSREKLRDAIITCLTGPAGVHRRLKVAGKWFAEAFWASNHDDAVLALGVALDALIGSKSGLPGRAMKERFALLDDDPQERSYRAKRYDEMYSVRSTVAHGGVSTRVNTDFVRGFEREVTWAAWRLLALQEDFSIATDADFESTLEGLKWGTAAWPTEGKGQGIKAMLLEAANRKKEPKELGPCGKKFGE